MSKPKNNSMPKSARFALSLAIIAVTFFFIPFLALSSPARLVVGRSNTISANPFTLSSDNKIEVQADVYSKDFAIIRVEGARPWRIFPRPKQINLTISGLDSKTTYYLYKEKLSNPEVFTPDNGQYTINLDTPRHRYLILKTSPSTYHIDANDTGNDCPQIGIWDKATLTCTLTKTVTDIIEIDDGNITLDGNGHTISHTNDIGIYANKDPIFDDAMANIKIKNLTIVGPTIGISLIDLPNGHVTNVSVQNSVTGISLKDDKDIAITRTNFIQNQEDLLLANTSGTILSKDGNRGNYWDKNTNCIQDANDHDYCTNSYTTAGVKDSLPWACENAWVTGMQCPYTPPTTRTPEPSSTVTVPPTTVTPPTIDEIKAGAIENAKTIIGAPYQWGGKGFDFNTSKFTNYINIKSVGYWFYDETIGKIRFGPGVDCSGLSMWSYNKYQYGDTKLNFTKCLKGACAIFYEGATDQYNYNVDHSITGKDLQPGDLLFFGTKKNGIVHMDHMALYTGETPYNVIHASGFAEMVTYADYELATEELVTKTNNATQRLKVTAYGRLIRPTVELIFYGKSPIDFVVTDPDGFVSSWDQLDPKSGPLEYQWRDVDDDGELNEIVVTGIRKLGDYKISVVPRNGAQKTDTYSLLVDALINGQWTTITLAENVSVNNIPKQPYILRSSPTGMTLISQKEKVEICHVPPGNPENPQNISIDKNALKAHINHGDYEGKCAIEKVKEKNIKSKKK